MCVCVCVCVFNCVLDFFAPVVFHCFFSFFFLFYSFPLQSLSGFICVVVVIITFLLLSFFTDAVFVYSLL